MEQRPGIILRLRAKYALYTYEKAEKPHRKLVKKMQNLEAEREAILSADRERRLVRDTSGTYAVGKEMLRINDKFVELNTEWESVDARMKLAYARVQAVLKATGYDKASANRYGDDET